MPSHTINSSVIQMSLDAKGAPWIFPQWQDITHIYHGLFSDNDALLPMGWSREMANFVKSYFDQYSRKAKEEDKIKFSAARSGADKVPGRDIWRKFIIDLWKRAEIHARITKVLSDENLHPLTLALRSSTGSIEQWPHAGTWIPLGIDSVARALFGEQSIGQHGRAHAELRGPLQAIIGRTWKTIRNQLDRSKTRIVHLEEEAIEAFKNLDRSKLTKPKIKNVILKVARWRALAEVLHTEGNLEKMEEMDEELKRLMVGLGAKLPVSSKKTRQITKISSQKLKSLASENDVADIINLYHDFFGSPALADSVALQDQRPTINIQLSGPPEGAGLGVDYESLMSPEILVRLLGFKDGLPLLFNMYRHTGGLSAWDPAHTHLFEPSKASKNPEMERFTLHWHQLAGLHALLRMNVSAKPAPGICNGALIADDVGLGKTFLLAATIAFLSDVVMRRSLSIQLPPSIEHNPYLGTEPCFPDLPHLILVPGTLLSQWETEMKVVFKPKSHDILTYGTGKALHEQFWASDGPFHTSKHKLSNRIILASHSALQQDFAVLYNWSKPASSALPWSHPPKTASYSTMVQSTLFGQRYLSCTLDEAQEFRNIGAKHSAALLLLEQTALRFILTATPLQTSTKDLAAMGRLVGLAHFHSEEALKEEKADISSIRKAKVNAIDETAAEAAARELQKSIALRMQGQFRGRILRRTMDSKNWKGERLITLPPCEEVMVIVRPTVREMGIIKPMADEVKKSVSAANSWLHICSRAFYVKHRLAVGFARSDMTEAVPFFKTLDEWEEKKSTKLDTCVRMCAHLLSRDDAPPMKFENGTVVYPDIPPPNPGEKVSQTTKILIYQEFPTLGPLLRNILDLYGIRYMFIDGSTSFSKRAEITKIFREDPDIRVLILSSVGGTGLNLTRATKIIFLDQPWSSQDELQVRGRAHRQGQKESVACFHVLADETADIILASLARGKQGMLNAFLQKEGGKEFVDLISGKPVTNNEEEYDETDPEYRDAQRELKKKEKVAKKGKGKKETAENGGRGGKKSGKKADVVPTEQGVTETEPELVVDAVPRRSTNDSDRTTDGWTTPSGTDDVPMDDIPSDRDGLTDDYASKTSSGVSSEDGRTTPSGTDDALTDEVPNDGDGLTDHGISMTPSHASGAVSSESYLVDKATDSHVTPPRQKGVRRRMLSDATDSPEVVQTRKRQRNLARESSPSGGYFYEDDGEKWFPNGPMPFFPLLQQQHRRHHTMDQDSEMEVLEAVTRFDRTLSITPAPAPAPSSTPALASIVTPTHLPLLDLAAYQRNTVHPGNTSRVVSVATRQSAASTSVSTPDQDTSSARRPVAGSIAAVARSPSLNLSAYQSNAQFGLRRPSGSSRDTPSIRQATLFRRGRPDEPGLSPPPLKPKSVNPFSRNPRRGGPGAA